MLGAWWPITASSGTPPKAVGGYPPASHTRSGSGGGKGLQSRHFPIGLVAEWLGKGLQNPVQRFDSAPDLQRKGGTTLLLASNVDNLCQNTSSYIPITRASGGMVYTRHLKCRGRKALWVRVPPCPPIGIREFTTIPTSLPFCSKMMV